VRVAGKRKFIDSKALEQDTGLDVVIGLEEYPPSNVTNAALITIVFIKSSSGIPATPFKSDLHHVLLASRCPYIRVCWSQNSDVGDCIIQCLEPISVVETEPQCCTLLELRLRVFITSGNLNPPAKV
jgi:hypothetical protein